MTILIAYATNSGSTEEVARTIANELKAQGGAVEVRRIDEVTSVEGYSAVVVGAPMILGWHRGAVAFVKKNQQALSRVPVAYFITAMSLTQTNEERVGDTAVRVDAEMAKVPRNTKGLSLHERYSTVGNYLRPVLRAAPGVRPVSAAFFGGKLELFRLNFLQMLFVMVVIRAQPGDYRNWPFIKEWANGLRPALLPKAR